MYAYVYVYICLYFHNQWALVITWCYSLKKTGKTREVADLFGPCPPIAKAHASLSIGVCHCLGAHIIPLQSLLTHCQLSMAPHVFLFLFFVFAFLFFNLFSWYMNMAPLLLFLFFYVSSLSSFLMYVSSPSCFLMTLSCVSTFEVSFSLASTAMDILLIMPSGVSWTMSWAWSGMRTLLIRLPGMA